ncbi:hypothetical protein AcW1_006444 [Taiwanofungus camphoratus]|nr:hypothetical protein AcV5_009028 [Antrodia cinnamomea]KAI0924284.1 hypothetical protein AcW2_005205 [Antrodia cinnamomea]KAI0940871.1 hypothetical protein AcV7_003133 [Antrodia cinnamomea]KAI0954608.1 hypothetical protein AcW1_006444 [Antrodia cinnamomea]
MASSRHGNVSINLFEIGADRCVDVDVSTRRGNIIVLPAFDGTVAFRTRRGRSGFKLLPAFAQRARITRISGRKTLIALSSSNLDRHDFSTSPQDKGDDYCVVSTRRGHITIGLSGVDQVPSSQEPSLLKMLGDFARVTLTGHT